ncbi:hypothetical protein AB833_09605 [Chromatiales bacterium (ex Bugula neritina AB1)]|nr:hypothetical protein AB833_09605 [Chromatiales bacterium (ex Bugula neritina AB1)]
MQHSEYDAVVIGAGIAGISACHALVRAGAGRVALIESASPMGLTSDKSTECYRNFWPGPDNAMASLVSDSINRLQELTELSGNRFQLHQRGYVFATAQQSEVAVMARQALQNEQYGGGPLRHHPNQSTACVSYRTSPADGFDATLDGTDLITDKKLIAKHFPYLAADTEAVLHARRCGVLSAQQLGMYLLEEARRLGVELITGEYLGSQTAAGSINALEIRTAERDIELQTKALVLACGPHLKSTAALAGTDLPVVVEPHVKISLADKLGVIARDAPLIIWNDPVELQWTAEERDILAASEQTRYLTQPFPAGVHGRPVGAGDQVFLYWTYDCEVRDEPMFPIESDPYYPEVLLRGMARMVPGLSAYLDPMPRPYVDGGFYTKTADNRPLIGPLATPGTFACGAYSGYGIMASYAGGELLASHVLGRSLPGYAEAFAPERFNDPAYQRKISGFNASGQI